MRVRLGSEKCVLHNEDESSENESLTTKTNAPDVNSAAEDSKHDKTLTLASNLTLKNFLSGKKAKASIEKVHKKEIKEKLIHLDERHL